MYKNIENQRAATRKHYHNNKDYYRQKNRNARQLRKEWFIDFMKDKSCSFCHENEKACLDWHHTDPNAKDFEIAIMVNQCFSTEKILEEVSKCICVCSNCHRKLHAGVLHEIQKRDL